MSVNPGFGGQEFIPQVLDKIKTLKTMIRDKGVTPLIEIDGGVKPGNISDIVAAGADILVMGSAFFNAEDYTTVVRTFREITGN